MDQRPRTDTTAEDTSYKERGRQGGALCLGEAYLGVGILFSLPLCVFEHVHDKKVFFKKNIRVVDFKIMLLLPRLFSRKILMMTMKHGDNGAELAGTCRSQSVFKDTASTEAQSHTRSDSKESANERLGKGSSAENRTTGARC